MASKSYNILGTDIALTRYVGTPAALALDVADSWGSLDVSVVPGGKGGLPSRAAVPIQDIGSVSARDNLAQALILRLLTPKGNLTPLGHPAYGSRLISLVGQLNNDTSRNLARLYTLEALAQEPRVKQPVLDLAVTVGSGPDVIAIAFTVQPIDDSDPLALSLEVQL